MSISRAVRNGNASFDRSALVSRCSSSRERGPLHVQLAVGGSDVGDEGVRVVRNVAPHPRFDVTDHRVGDDDQEALVAELGDGQVGLERAGVVQPLRVGDHPRRAVDVVGGDAIEAPAGVAALHQELAHERHVHDDDVVARRAMLGLPVREPALPAPGQRPRVRRRAWRPVPVGALPAAHFAEVAAGRRQTARERASGERRARSRGTSSDSGTCTRGRATRRFAGAGTPGSPGRRAGGRC